jgi:hypothetical protein
MFPLDPTFLMMQLDGPADFLLCRQYGLACTLAQAEQP